MTRHEWPCMERHEWPCMEERHMESEPYMDRQEWPCMIRVAPPWRDMALNGDI